MAKTRKCDECACQGICKIEDDYRHISKAMDQVFDPCNMDSYFSMPELVCHRFIQEAPVSHMKEFEKALRFNKLITEENKNGRA